MTFDCWCILEKVIFEDGAEVVSVWKKKASHTWMRLAHVLLSLLIQAVIK